MSQTQITTLLELAQKGKKPDILFWIGCAGSYDDRAKKVTHAIIKILNKVNISYGVLGTEEGCTGDPARRAGNEFLFQMQAINNIQIFKKYSVTKILTTCPHCFNTLKNEYPELGGSYEVLHHSTFIQQLIDTGKLKIEKNKEFHGHKITYHDSCYLGRANNIYEAPRRILEELDAQLVEMEASKKKGLCCGAGGSQMFKEPENGTTQINSVRTDQVLKTGAKTVAVACPFCMTMISDGLKEKGLENNVQVKDLAELISDKL